MWKTPHRTTLYYGFLSTKPSIVGLVQKTIACLILKKCKTDKISDSISVHALFCFAAPIWLSPKILMPLSIYYLKKDERKPCSRHQNFHNGCTLRTRRLTFTVHKIYSTCRLRMLYSSAISILSFRILPSGFKFWMIFSIPPFASLILVWHRSSHNVHLRSTAIKAHSKRIWPMLFLLVLEQY